MCKKNNNDDDDDVTITRRSAEILGVDVPGTVSFRVDSNDSKSYRVFDKESEAEEEAERRRGKK